MVAEASSKSQSAYRLILGMISDGALTAGARINVAQLSGDLEMSAVPIREALRLLEAEGLVEVLHNQGARVAAFDPVEYKDASELHAVLEAYAARISQGSLPDGTVDALRQANHDLREAFQDFDPHAFSEASIRFHSLLYAGAPTTPSSRSWRKADCGSRQCVPRSSLSRRGGWRFCSANTMRSSN